MLFSPYIFSWAYGNDKDHTIYSLEPCISKLGLKSITLAFLVSDKYDEILQWKDEIHKYKDKIEVRLSLGGALGMIKEPHQSCEETGKKIALLIDDLKFITKIDLDIEGESLSKEDNVNDWISIIKYVVKYCNHDLKFTLTLPVEFNGGLNNDALNTIVKFQNCKIIQIDTINLMLMDFFTPLDNKGHIKTWADKHIEILNYVHEKQLKPLSFSWSNMGICPMIGTNDDKTKFTLQDWDKVTDFAIQKNIGLITFWALNRDRKSTWFKSIGDIDGYSKCQNNDFEYANTILRKLDKKT